MMFNRIAFRSAIPIVFFTPRRNRRCLKNDSEDDFFEKSSHFDSTKSYFSVSAKKSVYFSRFLEVNRIAAVRQMFVNVCTKMNICKRKSIFLEHNAFRLAFPIFLATATTTDFCKRCRKKLFECTP